jgi:hypothetical protein
MAALGPLPQLRLGLPPVAGRVNRAVVLGSELLPQPAAALLARGEQPEHHQQHDHDHDADEQACVHGARPFRRGFPVDIRLRWEPPR